MNTRCCFLLLASVIASPHTALSDEADAITLHAEYLSEPTDWCASEVGVPVVITAIGPHVFVGEFDGERTSQITVRRGGGASERIDVGRVNPSQVRVGGGTNRRSVDRLYPRVDELVPAGRLHAYIQLRDTYWTDPSISANWKVHTSDGAVAFSGDFDRRFLSTGHPFFSTSGRYPKTIQLGDQNFIVMRQPEITRTTEAFVSPAEEQNQ